MFPIPIQKRPLINQISYRVLIPISLLIWLIPLIGIMLTSIRGLGDIAQGNLWGVPSEFLLFSNLKDVFQNTPMLSYIMNSFKITIPTMIGAVALSCMTGFALASYRLKANLFIFFTFIAGNFVPFQILMIPVRDLTYQMGLYDTVTGLVLFHVAFQTGFCTLFMRNFIKALPNELFEAARIDGTSEFNIFLKIVLPLTRPAIAALSVLIFTFIWNDFLGNCFDTRPPCDAYHSRFEIFKWSMDIRVSSFICRFYHGSHTTSQNVFFNEKTFHRWFKICI